MDRFVFWDASVNAPAEKCSCIFGVHASQRDRWIASFFGMPALTHPPKNAPAFSAYTPSLAIKKAAAFRSRFYSVIEPCFQL